MREQVFDRQGMIISAIPESRSGEIVMPPALHISIVRRTPSFDLRPDHVRELYHALGDWLDKIDGVKR